MPLFFCLSQEQDAQGLPPLPFQVLRRIIRKIGVQGADSQRVYLFRPPFGLSSTLPATPSSSSIVPPACPGLSSNLMDASLEVLTTKVNEDLEDVVDQTATEKATLLVGKFDVPFCIQW